MTELWVGNDFALGKNRAGDVNRIAEIGIDLGFSTVPLERLPTDGAPISSSRIRQAIERGEVDEANNDAGALLSRFRHGHPRSPPWSQNRLSDGEFRLHQSESFRWPTAFTHPTPFSKAKQPPVHR